MLQVVLHLDLLDSLNNSPPFDFSVSCNQLRGQGLIRYTGNMPSKWKVAQSKVKTKKRNRLALIVLGLVILFLTLSWVVQFAQSLFTSSVSRNYYWDAEFNINLLVRTNHTSVVSYSPKEEKITIINIPDETFVEVPYGFGKWQLRAVYELGESQKEMGGNKLLKDTLTDFFAIPIDGFLDLSALKSLNSASEVVNTIRQNPFAGLSLLSSLKTDLTLWEILRLKMGISGVRFDKIRELDLLKLGVLDKENLADGTQILTADPVQLDSVLSLLADPLISSEHKAIAVLNATGHSQFAGRWARLITNLGGNVIITSNASKRLDKTQVVGEKSLTLKRLMQIFSSDGRITPQDGDIASSRAQINLLLGEDYFKK